MAHRRLYKYFDSLRWAEAFFERGAMRFSTLAFFRDYEDAEIRGDSNEGTAMLRPVGGLNIRNHTQRRDMMVSGVEFQAKCDEIFVYCASNSATDEKRERFRAAACVEIRDRKTFCRRVQRSLPWKASFGGRPGHGRLGHEVQYYDVTDDINPRWACPDLIGLSKLRDYAWQDEYRLMFSETDALRFEKIRGQLVMGEIPKRTPNPSEHHFRDLEVGSIADIAVLHCFRGEVLAV